MTSRHPIADFCVALSCHKMSIFSIVQDDDYSIPFLLFLFLFVFISHLEFPSFLVCFY